MVRGRVVFLCSALQKWMVVCAPNILSHMCAQHPLTQTKAAPWTPCCFRHCGLAPASPSALHLHPSFLPCPCGHGHCLGTRCTVVAPPSVVALRVARGSGATMVRGCINVAVAMVIISACLPRRSQISGNPTLRRLRSCGFKCTPISHDPVFPLCMHLRGCLRTRV